MNLATDTLPSPLDQAYDGMAAHAQDIVNRAFADYPIGDFLSCNNRWLMICAALEKADAALTPFVKLTEMDSQVMVEQSHQAIDANFDDKKSAVAESVGAYLYVYRAAIDRQGAL